MSIAIGKIVVEKQQPQACDTCIFYYEDSWPSRPWDIEAGCIVAYVLANKNPDEVDGMLSELAVKGLCPFYESVDAQEKEFNDEELRELAQRKINALVVDALREGVQ